MFFFSLSVSSLEHYYTTSFFSADAETSILPGTRRVTAAASMRHAAEATAAGSTYNHDDDDMPQHSAVNPKEIQYLRRIFSDE